MSVKQNKWVQYEIKREKMNKVWLIIREKLPFLDDAIFSGQPSIFRRGRDYHNKHIFGCTYFI